MTESSSPLSVVALAVGRSTASAPVRTAAAPPPRLRGLLVANLTPEHRIAEVAVPGEDAASWRMAVLDQDTAPEAMFRPSAYSTRWLPARPNGTLLRIELGPYAVVRASGAEG